MIKYLLATLLFFSTSLVFAADLELDTNAGPATDQSFGLWGPYYISPDVGVVVYHDSGNDVAFVRTTDGGANWSTPADVYTGTAESIHVYYDRETADDTGTLLHIAWNDSTGSPDHVYYRTLDISDGSLGTLRDIASVTLSGASTDNRLAITKTRSGNLLVAYNTGTEHATARSTDGGVNWTTRASLFAGTIDTSHVLLFPANTSDDSDACALVLGANSVKISMYDDSADSWTDTAITGSFIRSSSIRNWDGAVRHSDKKILLAIHSNDDSTTDDLQTFEIDPSTISSVSYTGKTDVFTNQVESGLAAIIINQQNDDVYVAYGKGGTFLVSVDIVYHKSTDGMSTWGTEQAFSENTADDIRVLHGGRTIGPDGGRIQFSWFNDDLTSIWTNENNAIDIEAAASGGRRRFWIQ